MASTQKYTETMPEYFADSTVEPDRARRRETAYSEKGDLEQGLSCREPMGGIVVRDRGFLTAGRSGW